MSLVDRRKMVREYVNNDNVFQLEDKRGCDYVDESTMVKAAKGYGDSALDCLLNCAGR